MKFLLASGNAHKVEEFKILYEGAPLEVEVASEQLDIEETGETFMENALLKAKAYYEKFGSPVLSDDSGLTVEALPNLLGVKSARFAPELESQSLKNQKLLELLEGVENRRAYFTAVLCFYINPDEIYFFEGVLSGSISKVISGEKGFGYDPLFIGDGREQSLAEDIDWKHLNSHRAKAVASSIDFFKNARR